MVTLDGRQVKLAKGRENKRLAEQKFHELMAVKPVAPEGPAARVADVVDAFLAWSKVHRSAETNRNYVWYGQSFSDHSGFVKASELRPFHVTRWVDERGWKSTTERNARRSITRAFSWAVEQGILPKNPLQGMKCPRARTRARIITVDEFRTLVRNTTSDFKILLFALWQTGCRPKEVRTLRWADVREDRWVMAEHKTAEKVGKPRVVYLTPAMCKLMTVLRRRAAGESNVFLNSRGKPWSASAVKQRVMRLKKKLGLKSDLCTYMLRHAWGTNAVLNGVDVATVAELMGNSSEVVTRVYLHLAAEGDHLRAAVDRATRPVRHRVPATNEGDAPRSVA
jgi:integrase